LWKDAQRKATAGEWELTASSGSAHQAPPINPTMYIK
jgi:hypothetical protein